MKKCLLILLVISVLTMSVPVFSIGYEEQLSDKNYEYEVRDFGAVILLYNWEPYTDDKILNIPEQLGGYAVTGIEGLVAPGSIPSTVEINIPDTVTYINPEVFHDFQLLEKVNVSEGNVEYISQDGILFSANKSKLIFCGLTLEHYSIPEGVTEIVDSAFLKSNISSIDIPGSVEMIGMYSMSPYLTEIKVNENNNNFRSVDGILYNKDLNELIICPENKIGEVIIPEGVTGFRENAFNVCSLEGVTIPKSMEFLPENSFGYCCNLRSIIFSEGLKGLSLNAFGQCDVLKSLELPGSLIEIFPGCLTSELEKVIVNADNPVFYSDDGLLYTKGEKSELILCPQAKRGEVRIAEGTSSISQDALSFCRQITKLYVPKSIKDDNQGIRIKGENFVDYEIAEGNEIYKDVNGVLYDSSQTKLISYPSGRMGRYEIPSGTISVCKNAFCGNRLVEIVFPDTVDVIEDDAITIDTYSNYNWKYGKILYGIKGSCVELYARKYTIPFVPTDTIPKIDIRNDGDTYYIDYLTDLGEQCEIIAAIYFDDGKDCSLCNIELGNRQISLERNGGNLIKVFTWNNLNSMEPVYETYEYDLRYNFNGSINYKLDKPERISKNIDEKYDLDFYPAMLSLKPNVGVKVMDYVKLNYFNPDKEVSELYNDNINMFNAKIVDAQEQCVFSIYQNGKYVFHAITENGTDIFQMVKVECIARPKIESYYTEYCDGDYEIPEFRNTCRVNIESVLNPFASVKYVINDSCVSAYRYIEPYTEEEPIKGYFPEIEYEAASIFDNIDTVVREKQIKNDYIRFSKNGKYNILLMDRWGNASKKTIEIKGILN